MITKEQIARINELAHLKKQRELTAEEASEQQMLRRTYIDAMKANMKANLESITIENPDGSRISVKERHDEMMKRPEHHN
ncbi:MAG: DUF896 domain-containing protein [Lachnospiraceae bacterium]|nr:DUF896 domain-containing protein [Lachnospiraceae bacterium]